MYHGSSSISACDMDSKGYPSVTSNIVSMNCKSGSARWDVIRAAVTWTDEVCARVCYCVFFEYVCFCVCVCVCVGVCVWECITDVSMSIFAMESKERSDCRVGLCECELQMQGRPL